MKALHRALAVLAIPLVCVTATDAAPSFFSIHYQSYNNWKTYNANDFSNDVKAPWFTGNFGNGKQKVVQHPSHSSYKRLRVQFDKGKFGNDNLIAGSWIDRQNAYTMQYRVLFPDSWQFVRGGKLPGLTGGTHPSGGKPSRDGMSARVMWRRDSSWDGTSGGSAQNYLEAYHYWRGQAIAYQNGDSTRRYADRAYLQGVGKNTWYLVKMRVVRGDGSSDGRLKLWVNGVKKHDRGYRYVDPGDNWKIDAVFHHFFYGGGNSSWAPSKNTHLYFDNLVVDKKWF